MNRRNNQRAIATLRIIVCYVRQWLASSEHKFDCAIVEIGTSCNIKLVETTTTIPYLTTMQQQQQQQPILSNCCCAHHGLVSLVTRP